MIDLDDLIAEAREEESIQDKLGDGFSEGSGERAFYYEHRDRYGRLADALEAANRERDAAVAAIERVRAAVSGHPECDRYEEGDVISCGWKSAYASVVAALDGAPEPEAEPVTVHNFRWKYPSGRVSWTYRTREAAMKFLRHAPDGVELECSADNGKTWLPAEGEKQ